MAQKKRGPGRPAGSKNKKTKQAPRGPKTTEERIEARSNQLEIRRRVRDEIIAICLIAVGVFFIIALQTDAAGKIGEMLSDVFKGMFGFVAFFLPYYFIIYGILQLWGKLRHIGIRAVILLVVMYLLMALANSGRFLGAGFRYQDFSYHYNNGINLDDGGAFGMFVGNKIVEWLGLSGLYIICIVGIIICIILMLNTPISRFFDDIKIKRQKRQIEREERAKERERQAEAMQQQMAIDMQQPQEPSHTHIDVPKDSRLAAYDIDPRDFEKNADIKPVLRGFEDDPATKTAKAGGGRASRKRASDKTLQIVGAATDRQEEPEEPKLSNKEAAESKLSKSDFLETSAYENYKFPPMDLLKRGKSATLEDANSLRAKAMKLEDTLASFNIDAQVTNVSQGPAVTRYEVHPNSGVKVKGIKSLADDIALRMEAKSIRIEAPIPGKAAVGIEIENDNINMVTAREIIASQEFEEAKSKITFAVGRDIAGKSIVADLKSMPHLLVAGATGSGKSVCINSIITSILYKARPDEVKFVLVDPKVVELSNYNGIPHLLIPVVTDPAKAAAALNWAVAEMDERYRKFAEAGTRDLSSYNAYISKKKNKVKDGEVIGPMPQVVIIIDELADLMMAAPSQVEESICRLAQKARAAGMHLIVATQRPSVDVITGVIKANIPSRIAFAVSSQVDSRTILDMAGAEKLVGKGDMLFNPVGSGKPIRVQGCFISDKEVNDVIKFVSDQCKDANSETAADSKSKAATVLEFIERANTPEADKARKDDMGDELLPDAIDLVVSAGQASVSMLQRRFRIGYNRAARIIDMMEERQIVGPADGSRPRTVLISEEDLQVMREATEDIED